MKRSSARSPARIKLEGPMARAGALFSALLSALVLGPAAAEDTARSRPADAPSSAQDDASAERAGPELAQLEAELAEVMDELVAARARAGVLARALFRTELEVEVIRRADAQQLTRIVLRLDGAPVHDSDGRALASDRAELFTGYLAPGMHELAIEVAEAGRARAGFGYTRSERFQIEVKNGLRTRVELVLRDDSDMAEEAAEGDEGEYHVETELRVRYGRARD